MQSSTESSTVQTSQDFLEFPQATESSDRFNWPQVSSSPKNVKREQFYDKTADLLERSVTPLVKQALSKKHPNRANIKSCYKSSEIITGFIREVHEEISEETTLSPKDLSKFSALLVASVKDRIADAMVTQLRYPVPVNRVLFENDIFDNCRDILQEGKEDLLTAKREKNALTSSVSKVEYSNCRRLRRLDSLAELLELDSTISVCSAVTIIGEQMIVSANTSGELTNYELANLTRQKLLIIRDFLASKQGITIIPFSEFLIEDRKLTSTSVSSSSSSYTSSETDTTESEEKSDSGGTSSSDDEGESVLQLYYQRNLDLLATEEELREVVSQLNIVSRSTHDDDDAVQNLLKLLKSFYLDIGPFTAMEKQVILAGDVPILLPYVTRSITTDGAYLQIEQFILAREHIRTIPSSIGIDGFPANVMENNFHCEQLLLYFLQRVMDVQKAQIGISKGCCVTCDTLFQSHPTFEVRGTSGQVFPNTVDIFNLTRFDHVGSPIVYKQDGCRHKPSPGDTPGALGSPPLVPSQSSSSSLYDDLSALGKPFYGIEISKNVYKRKIDEGTELEEQEPGLQHQEDDKEHNISLANMMTRHGIHRKKKSKLSNPSTLNHIPEDGDDSGLEEGLDNNISTFN